jgi:isocitrate dehydrogenase
MSLAATDSLVPETRSLSPVPVTVAHGDGIGPEIMEAVLFALQEAGARLELETIEIGEQVYRRGVTSGIDDQSWESLRRTGLFLKAPITTPQGGGYKSLNVTTRKALGLFANVRPCIAHAPFVASRHPGMNLVVVRENEEDTYGGIEHQQTDEVVQCLKLITRPGCERIVRYAFEYARVHGRHKVSCFTKDNIMKLTDGLFHRVFDEIAQSYPEIEAEHRIIDIGAAQLADDPTRFDVIVTPNLYGDILSDIAAQLTGSVGLAGSKNIGEHCAMFEAVHGSAPDIAGRNEANPSGLLNAAILMLGHIGQGDVAETLENAWLVTLEDGVHTPDIASEQWTRTIVGTREFAREVAARLGRSPQNLPAADGARHRTVPVPRATPTPQKHKELVGVDIFVHWRPEGRSVEQLAAKLKAASTGAVELTMITNRGVKVFPDGLPETFCTDHWRCRFRQPAETGDRLTPARLLLALTEAGIDCIKTENLYTFDGEAGFSKGQGE